MLEMIKAVNLVLRFGLELWALYALGYGGVHLAKGMPLKIAFGAGLPLLAAVVWGAFVAPKASYPVAVPVRLLLETMIFGSAALSLYLSGRHLQALSFGVLVLINAVLMLIWKQ